MKRFYILLIIILLIVSISGVCAQESGKAKLNTVKDDLLGCEAKFDDQGIIKSMKCPGEAEMSFSDAKGIRIAQQKATMRAKANMAKFMKESVKSKEVIDDMTKTISERTGQKNESVRNSVEKFTEQVAVEADQLLKGVQVIYSDIDKDAKIVIVHVGVNRQTMKGADQLRGQMNRNLENQSTGSTSGASQEGTGRVIKKSKQYDDF